MHLIREGLKGSITVCFSYVANFNISSSSKGDVIFKNQLRQFLLRKRGMCVENECNDN